jgi:hypothetical protein
MANDPYEERIRESTRFLDDQYDKRIDEIARAARSAALNRAIAARDNSKVNEIMGIPSAGAIDAGAGRPKTSEESVEALVAGAHQLRRDIQEHISQCRLLPPALRGNWLDRLANLTDACCVSELEALRREVQEAYEGRARYFNYREVSRSLDLESTLSLVVAELRQLRDQCARYLSYLR